MFLRYNTRARTHTDFGSDEPEGKVRGADRWSLECVLRLCDDFRGIPGTWQISGSAVTTID